MGGYTIPSTGGQRTYGRQQPGNRGNLEPTAVEVEARVNMRGGNGFKKTEKMIQDERGSSKSSPGTKTRLKQRTRVKTYK